MNIKQKISRKNYNKSNKKSAYNFKLVKKNAKETLNFKENQQIFDDFLNWLNGIQEDEPIPLEVNYIYFILDFSQNDIVVSYSGDENLLDEFDYGFYSPLEGQYFDCPKLKIISNQIFIKKSRTKKQVFNLLKKICLKAARYVWFLKDKKIFSGERFTKIEL